MCGFSITSAPLLHYASQVRGPDLTTLHEWNGWFVAHHLLHITGEQTPQPFVQGERLCVFNGEIYNWRDFGHYRSDGEVILDAYREHGLDFARHFDGEFAIVILDGEDVIVATDPFACRPLWIGVHGIASYATDAGPGATKVRGNQVLRFHDGKVIDSRTVMDWDLTQHKTHTGDWIAAFSRSIAKRIPAVPSFLGLSSGYDSGAISCELLRQGADFKAYSITNKENEEVLGERLARIPNHDAWALNDKDRERCQGLLYRAEPFTYKDRFKDYDYKEDAAALGLTAICQRANRDGRRVYFSGQGADEILSDYGINGKKRFDHSEFAGVWPKEPRFWHSFADGTQIQYLNKEEYTAGHFGIETRYPFLDRDLVQEFLWLTPEVKNSHYKAPLHDYLVLHDWPFEAGVKRGFSCG